LSSLSENFMITAVAVFLWSYLYRNE